MTFEKCIFYGKIRRFIKLLRVHTPYILLPPFQELRTDEMLLNRAECYVRLGHVEKGLDDLNYLLSKRYKVTTFTPYTDLSQDEALAIVLKERGKELIMRGMRWMDLKRLNKEGRNIVLKRIEDDGEYTLLPNADFYALPIPDDIIELTGIPQNKG